MISVFYQPEMVVSNNVSISPSAGKPAHVIQDWFADPRIYPHAKVVHFDPVTVDMIKAVHDPAFVDRILTGISPNGFGNHSMEIADSLHYTSGSMLAAAQHAYDNNTVAVSPTSGFHHAEFHTAMGFCTFNGLMVTAAEMKRLHPDIKILILDFDMHYGNGTDHIIRKFGYQTWVSHCTNGNGYRTAKEALAICTTSNLIKLFEVNKYDLVLYQAGADIHIEDPYGGLLTAAEMIQRDRGIFQACAITETPLVWNLAGGYQLDADGTIEPVLKLHRNTMLECVAAYKDSTGG